MKDYRFLRIGLLFCCIGALPGQTGRETYRQAYDTWQQVQANLERDAGSGTAEQVAHADRSGAAAESFEATRVTYLKSLAQEATRRRQILETPVTRSSPDLAPTAVADLAAGELQTVTRTIAKFADDKDRAIQQLRQSLERERVALAALNESIQARQKTVSATAEAAGAAEQARAKTAGAFTDQTSKLSETISLVEMEGAAWAGYYDKLAQSIQVANAPTPPVTPVTPRTDTVSRVPLVRYVGAWMYPLVNGISHGAQPESIELDVREKNGHMDGSLLGRFKPVAGSRTDPAIRFTFEGEVGATPTQKFSLMTTDGATGTIELIPGPAFNLLEVNFLADPEPNKIRAGNFILVKK